MEHLNEQHIMSFVNNPFIMRFLKSFQDEFCIYFLLEYIQGQELWDALRDIGICNHY